MKVKISNGSEFEALGVHGRNVYYQGVSRDCLIFLFDPDTVTLESVRSAFTADNCLSIEVTDGSGTYIHENYTLRLELGEGYISHILDGSVGQDTAQCIYVRMAQTTLAERKLLQQQAAIEALVVAALEG